MMIENLNIFPPEKKNRYLRYIIKFLVEEEIYDIWVALTGVCQGHSCDNIKNAFLYPIKGKAKDESLEKIILDQMEQRVKSNIPFLFLSNHWSKYLHRELTYR